jgi:hypothetical protein
MERLHHCRWTIDLCPVCNWHARITYLFSWARHGCCFVLLEPMCNLTV